MAWDERGGRSKENYPVVWKQMATVPTNPFSPMKTCGTVRL